MAAEKDGQETKNDPQYEFDDETIRRRLRDSRTGAFNTTFPNIAHFYNHLPKTAGYYAFEMLSRMGSLSPEMKTVDERFRVCNIGTGAIGRRPSHYKQVKCSMYMSEKPYNWHAQNSYTIVRNPRHHVLSQYFHCAEGVEALKRAEKRGDSKMICLDDWLSFWAGVVAGNQTVPKGAQFGCYTPISMQSEYVKYDPQNKSRLQAQFTVIGPMDDLERTLCVIFIHYSGWVPGCCSCTEAENEGLGYINDENASTHGVKHHGSSYKTTQYQDYLIKMLVNKDSLLYAHVKALFHRQVEIIEQELNITLCKRLRRDEKWNFEL